MPKEASAIEVKNFFNIDTLKEFMVEWKSLNEKEQKYFKVELGKQLYPDS